MSEVADSGGELVVEGSRDLVDVADGIFDQVRQFRLEAIAQLGALASSGVSEDDIEYFQDVTGALEDIGAAADSAISAIDQHKLAERVAVSDAIDEDELYAMVRRYVERMNGAPFQTADLRDHLTRLGAPIPEDRRKFSTWMDNIFIEVAADRREQGKSERVTRFVHNGKRVIAFATIAGEDELSVDIAETETEEVNASVVTDEAAPKTSLEAKTSTRQLAVNELILSQITDGAKVRRQSLHSALEANDGANLSFLEIEESLVALCEAGQLHKVRHQGSVYFTTEKPVEIAKKQPESNEAKSTPEILGPADFILIEAIIKSFGLPGTHTSQRFTPRELRERIKTSKFLGRNHEIRVEDIRRLSRRLEDVGVTQTGQWPTIKGGHRSSSQKVFKVGIASQKVKDRLRDASGCRELFEQAKQQLIVSMT